MRKILSSLLVGAFVFGLGAADIQPVSAASLDKVKETKEKYDKAKDKYDKAQDIFGKNKNSDDKTHPEPPKDENGNPMPPPDRNSDDSNRPEPPKDSNGNQMPPPDKKDGDNNSKDRFGDMKDKYDSAKEIFEK